MSIHTSRKTLPFLSRLVSAIGLALLLQSTVFARLPVYDFTGDTRTDFTFINFGTTGTPIVWWTLRNPALTGPNQAFIRQATFGVSGDPINPGNFFGTGKSELSFWRNGVFYPIAFPESGSPSPVPIVFGSAGDIIGRDGDYDGDGKLDATVIRVVSNQLRWFYYGSTGVVRGVQFGQTHAGTSTLEFPGADFNGDQRDEFVVAQVNNATGATTWWIGDSLTGASVLTVNWGNFDTDFMVVPDDYTGDGVADIVCWRGGGTAGDAGAWYIRNTVTGGVVPPVVFGVSDPNFINNDYPLRGDYDGDGRADVAVWRPTTATWYWLRSSDGTLGIQQWGHPGVTTEFPLSNLYNF